MSRANREVLIKKIGATKLSKISYLKKRNIYAYVEEDVASFLNIELQTLRDLICAGKIDPSSFESIFKYKIKDM